MVTLKDVIMEKKRCLLYRDIKKLFKTKDNKRKLTFLCIVYLFYHKRIESLQADQQPIERCASEGPSLEIVPINNVIKGRMC